MLFAMLSGLVNTAYGDMYHGQLVCRLSAVGGTTAAFTSITSITTTAVVRYVNIVRRDWRKFFDSWKKAAAICVAIWLHGCALLLPISYGSIGVEYRNKVHVCNADWSNSIGYNLTLVVFGTFIPVNIMASAYIGIYREVKRSKRRVQANTSTVSKQQSRRRRDELRLTLQLVVIFLVLCTCWMPGSMLNILLDPQGQYPQVVYEVVFHLMLVNSAANPIIYLYFNRIFRNEVIRVFRCSQFRGGDTTITKQQTSTKHSHSQTGHSPGTKAASSHV
jgi:neuropeptide FF receptor 2